VTQASGAASTAHKVASSRKLETLARVGFVVSGLLHLLIGWLALQLAFGTGAGQEADQSGALAQVASQPFGEVVLWVGVAGFAALALWQLTESAWGHGSTSDTVKAAAKGVVYLALAWTTFTFARGGSTSSSQKSADVTATVMSWPGGRVLVGVIGLAILGVGVWHVVKGWKKKFLEDLAGGTAGSVGTAVVRLGQFGYVAKGVALGVVGILFLVAAWRADPSRASGLDGSLRTLRDQPFGPVLLCLVALGLVAYGLYSFARARFARM
jgi:hypothetical protein